MSCFKYMEDGRYLILEDDDGQNDHDHNLEITEDREGKSRCGLDSKEHGKICFRIVAG